MYKLTFFLLQVDVSPTSYLACLSATLESACLTRAAAGLQNFSCFVGRIPSSCGWINVRYKDISFLWLKLLQNNATSRGLKASVTPLEHKMMCSCSVPRSNSFTCSCVHNHPNWAHCLEEQTFPRVGFKSPSLYLTSPHCTNLENYNFTLYKLYNYWHQYRSHFSQSSILYLWIRCDVGR